MGVGTDGGSVGVGVGTDGESVDVGVGADVGIVVGADVGAVMGGMSSKSTWSSVFQSFDFGKNPIIPVR